jgi:DNA-binding response OmpR family regulator
MQRSSRHFGSINLRWLPAAQTTVRSISAQHSNSPNGLLCDANTRINVADPTRRASAEEEPMPRSKVLLVSDDPLANSVWGVVLGQLEAEVFSYPVSKGVIDARDETTADLIVIDESYPKLDGISLISRWRSGTDAPIVLLTGGDHDRALEAYRVGVDECCIKPLSPDLFLAKMRAWLRHSTSVPMAMLAGERHGPIQLVAETQEVFINDERITLTNLEFRLLHVLITNANQTVAPQVLVDRVWGYSSGVEGTVLKNGIYRLRQKIEPNPAEPRYIVSVTGEGYMFKL